MLAFKIAADPHLGKLTFVRVYSGVPRRPRCSTRPRAARSASARSPDARQQAEEIESIGAGDICAVIGPEGHHHRRHPVRSREPGRAGVHGLPDPVIEQAIEPKTKSDQEKLAPPSSGWPRRIRPSASTPTRRPARPSSPAWASCTSGPDRPHEARVRVEANVGKPQVAYRETISAEGRERSSTRTRSRPVVQASTPRSSSTWSRSGGRRGYEFVNAVTGGRIPREYIPRWTQGHPGGDAVRRAGRLPGRDMKVTLLDGAYHDVDSSEWRSRSPVRWRFKEAARKADPVLLEPI